MAKISLYPKTITQPNKNKSSGLAGTCFKEIRRNGKKYNVNCRDQNDPKYHHQWINTENLKTGKTAQCGKASKYHCSHATYYGIKGYRNTCPIAGVTGTYTQPATLRMGFDVRKIPANSKVNSVTVKFKHRCVGVDVSNSSTTLKWGPNFYGFNHYPKRKVLKLQFVNKKGEALSKTVYQKSNGTDFSNPPLSKNYTEITAVFKDISYTDLKNGFLELRYGNNLSTNPGNIYLKGFQITIDYDPEEVYLEGKMDKDTLVTSTDSNCQTSITFTLDAGYKNGKKKTTNTALKNTITPNFPDNVTATRTIVNNKVVYKIIDSSNKTEKKTVSFSVKGKTIKFDYKAISRQNPTMEFPTIFEHNVFEENMPIIAKNGCASNIKIYFDGVDGTPLYEIQENCINNKNQNNIILNNTPKNLDDQPCFTINELYKTIAQQSCGIHSLYIQFNNEPINNLQKHNIRIDPVPINFTYLINNQSVTTIGQSAEPSELKIIFNSNKNFIEGKFPQFQVTNPITNQTSDWDTEISKEFTTNIVATKPGSYIFTIKENGNTCSENEQTFKLTIEPTHKQYYDTLFVKTEGPMEFSYDYLTVWEGDTNEEPVYMNNITLQNSPENLCFYAPQQNQSGITEVNYFPLNIKNKGNEDIENLFVELNVLRNNRGKLEATTDEWVEVDGMFLNFKNNFEEYNKDLENIVSIINLTPDSDFIDEENVYIRITKIKAGKSLNLKIPFGSRIEKEIILQLLLFETPVQIYPNINCTGTRFTDIQLNTFDSILTDLNITGEFNLFDIDCDGSNKVYKTELTYKAQNIDTVTLERKPILLIKNDPRLIAYAYKYPTTSETIKSNFNSSTSPLQYHYGNSVLETPMINQNITGTFTFLNDFVYKFKTTTDESGQAKFYVTIPEEDNNEYIIEDILKNAIIEYEGAIGYPPAKMYGEEENGTVKIKNDSSISVFTYLPDNNSYKKNETIIITVVLTTKLSYIQNELEFKANIINPGQTDEITVLYKILNLKNDSGILNTIFKTNEVELIPNEIEKDIYCRVKSNLDANTYLIKRVVEEREVNTLRISLANYDRENEDIRVEINELNIPKYELLSINTDVGEIITEYNNNDEISNIIWKIDYLNKNDIVRGTFDFVAKDLDINDETNGLSTMQIIVTDFLSNKYFNEVDCQCTEENNTEP